MHIYLTHCKTHKAVSIQLHNLMLYFSYETLIGCCTHTGERYRVLNRWGPTTGRHFNHHGLKNAQIISEDELKRIVVSEISDIGGQQLEQKLVRSL